MSKPITAAVFLGSLTLLLQTPEPVTAAPRTCMDKWGACANHCITAWDTTEGAFRCVSRTCDHQFEACAHDNSSGGGGGGGGGGKGSPTSGKKPKDEGKGGKPSGTNFSSVLLRIRRTSAPPAPSFSEPLKSGGDASIITSDQGGGGSTSPVIRDHRGDRTRTRPVWRDQVILRDHRVRYGYHCSHSVARQHKCIPWNAIIHDHRARARYGQSGPDETAITRPPSILEPTSGFSPQGPAATGTPVGVGTAAPAPNVILR